MTRFDCSSGLHTFGSPNESAECPKCGELGVPVMLGDFCGCCGRKCVGDWCDECRSHVKKAGAIWDRTYYAQHGKECPNQISYWRVVEGGK